MPSRDSTILPGLYSKGVHLEPIKNFQFRVASADTHPSGTRLVQHRPLMRANSGGSSLHSITTPTVHPSRRSATCPKTRQTVSPLSHLSTAVETADAGVLLEGRGDNSSISGDSDGTKNDGGQERCERIASPRLGNRKLTLARDGHLQRKSQWVVKTMTTMKGEYWLCRVGSLYTQAAGAPLLERSSCQSMPLRAHSLYQLV